MAHVALRQLRKTYADKSGGEVAAVKGVNLEIHDGEFMVLVGPSGCGKSTTLRMVAGLEEISGGTIEIDGRVVNDVAPKDRDIAMVFQNYALYPHMSVYENLAFGLKLRKLPKAEIDARVQEAAEMLGLQALLERKPKALSGGQRQRVAVGRAIVRKPKVFLFDEPLSNLDAKMRVAMRTEIARLHERLKATVIYVTHDQVEAMTMGDRICVMKDGEIMQVAEPLALYNAPANQFVAGFIGSPPMNFFPGVLREQKGEVLLALDSANTVTLPASLAEKAKSYVGQRVVLGVRPEALALGSGETAHLRAVVELVEPMGAETFLYVKVGTIACVARVHPSQAAVLGETVPLVLDLTQARLFAADTERALG